MSRLNDSDLPFSLLQFYRTASYPCSYLKAEQAISLVATPPHLISTEIYGQLIHRGFRRSGLFTYRPDCPDCQACIPVRLPVAQFAPNRTQRRALKTHAELTVREMPLMHCDDHYQLYLRYQAARHAGGGMDQDNHEQYANFLLQSRVDSRLVEFSDNGVLRMVSIIDVLPDGLSSVYTFYDPDVPGATFGTYNILWQIAQCKLLQLPFLYLGYWIGESRKMAYKANFRPIEGLTEGRWSTLDAAAPETPPEELTINMLKEKKE
jgi:arginyl-tRNA--protein-N-Asp/Glu arginylyltransferase